MADQNVIGAGEFKAKCLKLLDEVAETGEAITITKHGKPVARLVPAPKRPALFGLLKGTGRVDGDIISPIEAEWDALK